MNNFQKITIGSIAVLTILFLSTLFFVSKDFSGQNRYVEVKGLSEKIVKADQAIWSISFDVKSNDVKELYKEIAIKTKKLKDFLVQSGFEESEINTAPIRTYQHSYKDATYRYNSTLSMSVYTNKVDLVRATTEKTLKLLEQEIVLTQNFVEFEFSDLNSVKPEMLGEAIKNARSSAKKFAEDAQTSLGALARAQQGVFSITEKDQGSPEYKKIRVVSTLRYLLD